MNAELARADEELQERLIAEAETESVSVWQREDGSCVKVMSLQDLERLGVGFEQIAQATGPLRVTVYTDAPILHILAGAEKRKPELVITDGEVVNIVPTREDPKIESYFYTQAVTPGKEEINPTYMAWIPGGTQGEIFVQTVLSEEEFLEQMAGVSRQLVRFEARQLFSPRENKERLHAQAKGIRFRANDRVREEQPSLQRAA